MKLSTIVQAYRAIKAAEKAEEDARLLQELRDGPMTVQILRDIVNSVALGGVAVKVTLRDGAVLDILPRNEYEIHKQAEALAREYV